MNTDVTLKSSDFATIHNALYDLQFERADVFEQVEIIRSALKGCYEQEREARDAQWRHFTDVAERHFLNSIWSIFEVDDLYSPHPFKNAKTVTYRTHSGTKPVVVDIRGNLWVELYVAAEAAIIESGDEHHIFIEHFEEDGDTLILTTGS